MTFCRKNDFLVVFRDFFLQKHPYIPQHFVSQIHRQENFFSSSWQHLIVTLLHVTILRVRLHHGDHNFHPFSMIYSFYSVCGRWWHRLAFVSGWLLFSVARFWHYHVLLTYIIAKKTQSLMFISPFTFMLLNVLFPIPAANINHWQSQQQANMVLLLRHLSLKRLMKDLLHDWVLEWNNCLMMLCCYLYCYNQTSCVGFWLSRRWTSGWTSYNKQQSREFTTKML